MFGSTQCEYYTQITQAKVVQDPSRNTCAVQRPDGSIWSPEELTAMQFAYIKDVAEREAGESVSEAVVTVRSSPSYTLDAA